MPAIENYSDWLTDSKLMESRKMSVIPAITVR